MSYNLTNKDIKELTRLYPKIKVPFFKMADYYLKLQGVDDKIMLLHDCKEKYGDLEHYKMSKFEEILKFFKTDTVMMDTFNAAELPTNEEMKSKYPKSFGNWNENRVYVSIDMVAACWSVFKKVVGRVDDSSWELFTHRNFDLHPFVAKSKSFRQFVFGNLNPSRQQSFQKAFMIKLADRYTSYGVQAPVMLSADELIYEFPIGEEINIPELKDLDYEIKMKLYHVERTESYGEKILIKHDLDSDTKELFGINGSRYFIHFKNCILHQEVEENDLFFEPEPKMVAKWVLDKMGYN